MAAISKGDDVTWNTPQGTTEGTVQDVKTSPFQHDGQKFDASDDEPYVVVESAKSGKTAAHKMSSVDTK